MDFSNNYYGLLFEIAGIKIYLTDTLISMWVVTALLLVFSIIVRIKLKKFAAVPKGFQNVVEIMVGAMDDFTVSSLGKEFRNFGGFFFGLFAFIICANYSGMLGLRPPTADVATTAALAILIFVVTHAMGIAKQKGNYFRSFVEPNVIFLPINLIGEVSNLLSMCFRMFGNILGGVIILGLVYGMFPPILRVGIPAALHAYFDIFSGALQAYIFTVLAMTFIKQKAAPD